MKKARHGAFLLTLAIGSVTLPAKSCEMIRILSSESMLASDTMIILGLGLRLG